MSVASIAENFSQFENLSGTILSKCREFLLSVLKVPDDFFGFAGKYEGTELADVAFKLLAGIEKDKVTAKSCCELKTCRRGKPMLNISDFELGMEVKLNSESNNLLKLYPRVNEATEITVGRILKNKICVKVNEWVSWRTNIVSENVATFLFCMC